MPRAAEAALRAVQKGNRAGSLPALGTPWRWRVRIATVVLVQQLACGAVTAQTSKAPSAHSPAQDSKRVELLYSGDDAVCRPLATLYDTLAHMAPRDADWEHRFAARFEAIGFETLRPLNNPLHPFDKSADPTHRSLYYRADLSGGGKQLIHFHNTPLGTNGAFITHLWIFRPGADIDLPPDEPFEHFPPEKLEMGILGDGAEPDIGVPYFFDKIATAEQRSLPIAERVKREPSLGGPLAQAIFRVKSYYVFTAKEIFLGTALVYKIRAVPPGIDDLCYLAAVRDVQYYKQNGGH
jgi:hypothetical protein